MSKVVDITDKLSFDENPVLKVKEEEIEINSDATTILKLMGEFSNKSEVEASLAAAELLFGEEGMEKIGKMKLQTKDFMIIVQEAMNVAMGNEEEPGEK